MCAGLYTFDQMKRSKSIMKDKKNMHSLIKPNAFLEAKIGMIDVFRKVQSDMRKQLQGVVTNLTGLVTNLRK